MNLLRLVSGLKWGQKLTNADKFEEVFGIKVSRTSNECDFIDCQTTKNCNDNCPYYSMSNWWNAEYDECLEIEVKYDPVKVQKKFDAITEVLDLILNDIERIEVKKGTKQAIWGERVMQETCKRIIQNYKDEITKWSRQ